MAPDILTECPICLEPMSDLEQGLLHSAHDCTAMSCGHQFHTTCLNSWITRSKTQFACCVPHRQVSCPMCRCLHIACISHRCMCADRAHLVHMLSHHGVTWALIMLLYTALMFMLTRPA